MPADDGFCGVFRLGEHRRHQPCVDAKLTEPKSQERRQPIASVRGKRRPITAVEGEDPVSIHLHGEIDNVNDLCRQLDLPADLPLTDVLLAAWRRWSVDFLPRLNGVFALSLQTGSELLLYRDPSGLRNLYYHAGRDGKVAFASHLGALQSLREIEPRLARRSLHEYLRFLEVAPPNTWLDGVTAVEAGQLVRCTAQCTEARGVPAPYAGGLAPANFDDAVDQLDAHLHRSVRTCLEGSARAAAFLSGGIDSALLCAIAARQRNDLTALTVGFEAAPYDETPVAQAIAADLGLRHEVLRFSRADFLSAFDRLSRCAEQPMADPAAMATVLAFDHAHRYFDVVLDGTGADEALGMMPPRHVRVAVADASRLPPRVRKGLSRLLRGLPGLAGYLPIVDFEHPADTMTRWRGFTRPEIELLCAEPVSFEHTQFYQTFARFPRHAHFERYSALLNAMTCDRLNQAMLICGTSVRYPFWDADTDRFIRKLRTEYCYLPGEPKRILRALLARYVPRPIWDVPKHGFNFPLREFLAAEDFALLRQHLDPDRWPRTGFVSVDGVRRYAQRFMAGDQGLTFRVWALVVLGAWLEQHSEILSSNR